jgi:hypothetical protein
VRRPAAEAERVRIGYVSGNFFPVLGLKPALGRLVGPRDVAAGAQAGVAVVSWSYWKGRFNLDPRILGQPIIVENVPLTIVGVTPRAFSGLQVGFREELWLPAGIEALVRPGPGSSPRHGPVRLVGRMKPGAAIGQVRAEIAVLYQRSIDAGLNSGRFVRIMKTEVEPAGAGLSRLRQQFAATLVLVMAVVCRVAAADRVYQRVEPVSSAWYGPPARDGLARLSGREPGAVGAPSANRIFPAFRRGLRGRSPSGVPHCPRTGANHDVPPSALRVGHGPSG